MSQPWACQACGKGTPKGFQLEDLGERSDWKLRRVPLSEGFLLEIVLCPVCAPLEWSYVFDHYQRRIKSGLEMRYH